MNVFKASEILKIAIQIEKNGFVFFNDIKKKSRTLPVQELFGYLAGEEVKHEKTFENLLDQTEDLEPAEAYPGEYQLYINGLAGENIFTNDETVKNMAKKAISDKEAVEIGMGFEKDSIIFFNELKKFVPSSAHKVVDKVVDEEKVHLRKLTELKGKL